MEPEEYDAINEARHPQNSERDRIERIVWHSNDEVRNGIEIYINTADYRLRQTISNENDVTQNGRPGEMRESLRRDQIRYLITASYNQSEIRRYNFWTRRLPEENSDHTVPGIEVSTYLTPPSSRDQVVPCGTNQAGVPIRENSTLYQPNINSRRVFGEQVRQIRFRNRSYLVITNRDLNRNIPSVAFSNSSRGTTGYPGRLTGMRENGHNQNVLSRQDSYIDQTNVNLSVDCQKRKPKRKRRKDIKVCQNHQECKSRRVNERACRLNSCHEITELEDSSSAGQLASSVTQDSQCQNGSSSTSLVNVPKRGQLELHLQQNHKAKFPVPSTSMQTCNKERTASSEKQNNPNSSPVNCEMPSTSTGMTSSTIAYNTYPESISNLQSPFLKLSSFSNRNVTLKHNYIRPQVPQFSNAQITSCSSNKSLQENLYNDNSSVCLKNTDNKNSLIKEKTTGVPLQAFRSSARNPLQPFNRHNELISNKPMPLNSRKMTEIEINNKESISKNSQKEGENSLYLLNVVNSDMQRAEPILMETHSRNDNNNEYVDTNGSSKPNTEDSTTSISYINLSKDSTSNSKLETNQDAEIAETYRKSEIENSPLSNFASDSMNSAASNKKTSCLKASIEKSEISESFCDKASKLTSTKLNSDKHKNSGVVLNLLGDSDEQVKENIPPDNSLPN